VDETGLIFYLPDKPGFGYPFKVKATFLEFLKS